MVSLCKCSEKYHPGSVGIPFGSTYSISFLPSIHHPHHNHHCSHCLFNITSSLVSHYSNSLSIPITQCPTIANAKDNGLFAETAKTAPNGCAWDLSYYCIATMSPGFFAFISRVAVLCHRDVWLLSLIGLSIDHITLGCGRGRIRASAEGQTALPELMDPHGIRQNPSIKP